VPVPRVAGLTALVGVAVLLGLGVWQVQRAAWKDGVIADRTARLARPAVPLPSTLDDPAGWDLRPVVVVGRFDHAREMTVLKPARDGRSGYRVVTPLLRSGDGAVLVDRGWVPLDRRDPATRAEGQIAGEVAIAGVVGLGDDPGPFTPDNDPASGTWFWIEPEAMARAAGLEAPPVVVEAAATEVPGGLPEGGQTAATLENPHRGYALTWSALAVALALIYLVYRRRQRSREP
jgi:surfeit locus 1 family protein